MPRNFSIKSIAIAAGALLQVIACQRTQAPLEGAWRVVDRVVTGDSGTNHSPQPSLYLFAKRHYSIFEVSGSQPRGLFATENPTDAEKIAAYDSFIANTGTYETADSTLTTHPIVARSPAFMAGGSDRYRFHVAGDTLWLGQSSTDLRVRIGNQLVASTGPRSETQLKLVRAE